MEFAPRSRRRYRDWSDLSRPAEGFTMSAVYYQGHGAFSLGEAAVSAPAPGEVRLDVAYCGVCGTDLHIAHGAMDARIAPPQVIGHEMSGTVAEIGEGVDGLRAGDPVVVRPLDTRHESPADRGF